MKWNRAHTSYALTCGQTITWGSWSTLDPATGKILWQTADPTAAALDTGSVSVANGVLYAGPLNGHMYALGAATGKILWSYASGGSVIDGPAIADGVIYWCSGYARIGGTGNSKVYAFTVARPLEQRAHTETSMASQCAATNALALRNERERWAPKTARVNALAPPPAADATPCFPR